MDYGCSTSVGRYKLHFGFDRRNYAQGHESQIWSTQMRTPTRILLCQEI